MVRTMRWTGRLAGVTTILLSLSACGGGTSARDRTTAPKIDDAWLARVSPENLAPVEDARAQRQAQEDELNRAKVAQQDAENQLTIAKNEERTAKAAVDTAKARLEAAKQQGQAPETNQAQVGLEKARLAHRVAEANRERADQAVEAAKARVTGQEKEVKLAENFVSQA